MPLLPSCRDIRHQRSYGPVSSVGYVTKDYHVRRSVVLPNAWHDGTVVSIDLVETYWSIRTAGGVQDVAWPPSLNVHALLVTDNAIDAALIDQLYRSVLALQAAVGAGGIGELTTSGVDVSFYVRGVVIGSAIADIGHVIGALARHTDVPIALATATYSPEDGIVIHDTDDAERYFRVDHQSAMVYGRDLVGNDELVRTRGFWTVVE